MPTESKRSDFFFKSSAISPKVLNLFAFIDCNKSMPSLIRIVLKISKIGSVCIIETFCSSCCVRSVLLIVRIVPSSWNNDVGIGPIGKDRTFSTVTSSRQFARTSARRKTNSGFTWTVTVSPERHFSLVFLVLSSNDFNLDRVIGL